MQQAPDTSSIQEPSKQQHAGSQAGTKVTGISRLLDSNQGLRVPIRDSHCAWVYREYEPQGREREYFLSPSSLSPLVTLQRKTPGGRRRELLLHPARTSLVTSDYARFPYFQVAGSAAIHHRLVSLSFFLLRQHARHPSPLRSPRVSSIDALSKRARPFPSLHRHSFLRFSHCPFEGWPLVIVPEPTTTTMMTRTIGEEREREFFFFFFSLDDQESCASLPSIDAWLDFIELHPWTDPRRRGIEGGGRENTGFEKLSGYFRALNVIYIYIDTAAAIFQIVHLSLVSVNHSRGGRCSTLWLP